MTTFRLPDLGEGLPDAEIVEWFAKAGDTVGRDQPLVTVETAKAIVEIPSPQAGVIRQLLGEPGDLVRVGDPLVVFADAEEHGTETAPDTGRQDTGTVVGEVKAGREVLREDAAELGPGIRATPAIRALARRLEVDLSVVTPSGPRGLITSSDVQRAAQTLTQAGPLEPLRGPRRAMARTMAGAHAEVATVTVSDDVDINAWPQGTDAMLRLIRAIATACRAEPALNAWYDSHAVGRRLRETVDLGIAVDTEDGLFVPVLRDIGNRGPADLRQGLDRLKADVRARSIPPEELRGYTFTLSNFGVYAGRYADPAVVPPTVAILGAGRIRPAVVPAGGKPAVHNILPLSLSFDHRAVTGGEATRFLAALMQDLEKRS